MSVPPTSPTCGTTSTSRHLSILKKFGNCLKKGTSHVTNESSISDAVEKRSIVGDSGQSGHIKDMADTVSMPMPPPPKKVNADAGDDSTLSGCQSGKTFRNLFDDLNYNRMRFEEDGRELEKVRIDIKNVDMKITRLKLDTGKAERKFKELVETAGIKRTDIHAAEIRCKVLDETLKKSEKDLITTLDELHEAREETSKVCSSYLNETVQFALQWNGTELGQKNRIHFYKQELDNLERQKRQLEFELSDFIVLQTAVEECEKDVQNLNQQYENHDEAVSNQEFDLQNQIDELDKILKELERCEEEFHRSSADEAAQLEKRIDEKQKSIEYLQQQSSETKTAVKTQKGVSITTTTRNQQSKVQQQNVTTPNAKIKSDTGTTSDNLKSDDFIRNRLARFHNPMKAQLTTTTEKVNGNAHKGYADEVECNNVSHFSNDASKYVFPNSESNSNEEEMCLIAAAAEVSQALRDNDQAAPAPTPSCAQSGQPHAKVRAVECKTPVSFNNQVSSTKVIKRLPRTSQGKTKSKNTQSVAQVTPLRDWLRVSAPPTRKNFQFKKKVSVDNTQTCSVNQENLYDANSSCIDSTTSKANTACSNVHEEKDVPELYDDMPFSRFSSSRVLLTETQERRFGLM